MGDDAGIDTADRGWRLADRNTARGLDDAGIGTAVGAGVGAAVGDGIDTAVGDESGKVVGDGSGTIVDDGISMDDDAGIGTADRGWRLADQNTARGLDDAGIGAAVGAGVGAAVGDGIDTAVGDESGKVVGDGSSPVVGDGLGMGDDAGIDTADRGWRLADRNTARGLDDAGIGTAVGAGVGAAVGDGIDTAVGDESGKVVGDGSGTIVDDGISMDDDAGIGTADRGWRLADQNTARGLDVARWPTERAQAARASVAATSVKQLRLDGGRSVGPQRRLAICILRAGVFTLLLVADSLPGRAPQHEGTTVPKGVSRVAWGIPTEDRRRTAWLTSLEGPIAPTTVSLATFCCCDVRDRLRRETQRKSRATYSAGGASRRVPSRRDCGGQRSGRKQRARASPPRAASSCVLTAGDPSRRSGHGRVAA